MKTWTKTILAALMTTAVLIPSMSMADEPVVKKVNKETRVVVFPFEGVNVSPNMLAASSEILTSSMVNAGFVAASWKRGQRIVQDREAVQSAPAPQAAPVEEAPYESTAPAPGESADEFGGTDDEVAPVAQPAPVVPPAPVAPPVRPRSMAVELTDELKSQITEALGCPFYIDGKMIRLGSNIRVSINMKTAGGDAVKNEQMEALTEDDLTIIFERVSLAFVTDTTAASTLTMDNATVKESSKKLNTARVVGHHGMMLGGGGIFEVDGKGDANRGLVMFGYAAVLEIQEMRIGINAGLAFSDSDRRALMAGFAGYGYLSHTPVAPYFGGGAGVYLGSLVGPTRSQSSSAYGTSDGDNDFVTVGFNFFPALGMEFLRQAKIRMSMEIRYNLYVTTDGDFGHGPIVVMGVAF